MQSKNPQSALSQVLPIIREANLGDVISKTKKASQKKGGFFMEIMKCEFENENFRCPSKICPMKGYISQAQSAVEEARGLGETGDEELKVLAEITLQETVGAVSECPMLGVGSTEMMPQKNASSLPMKAMGLKEVLRLARNRGLSIENGQNHKKIVAAKDDGTYIYPVPHHARGTSTWVLRGALEFINKHSSRV